MRSLCLILFNFPAGWLVLVLCFSVPGFGQDEKRSMFRFGKRKAVASEEPGQAAPKPGSLGYSSGVAYIPKELKELADSAAIAMAKGNWFEARGLFSQMVLKAPDSALVYSNLGVAEYKLKNFSAAESNFQKALQLEPGISQSWMTLGLIQLEKRDFLLAISSLTRAIHQSPNSVEAHLGLAAATYEYGWINAATSELERVIELDPENTDAHFNLAMTYLGMKSPKVELARRHYYEALKFGAESHPGIERFFNKQHE